MTSDDRAAPGSAGHCCRDERDLTIGRSRTARARCRLWRPSISMLRGDSLRPHLRRAPRYPRCPAGRAPPHRRYKGPRLSSGWNGATTRRVFGNIHHLLLTTTGRGNGAGWQIATPRLLRRRGTRDRQRRRPSARPGQSRPGTYNWPLPPIRLDELSPGLEPIRLPRNSSSMARGREAAWQTPRARIPRFGMVRAQDRRSSGDHARNSAPVPVGPNFLLGTEDRRPVRR